jgi:hypothetical protein
MDIYDQERFFRHALTEPNPPVDDEVMCPNAAVLVDADFIPQLDFDHPWCHFTHATESEAETIPNDIPLAGKIDKDEETKEMGAEQEKEKVDTEDEDGEVNAEEIAALESMLQEPGFFKRRPMQEDGAEEVHKEAEHATDKEDNKGEEVEAGTKAPPTRRVTLSYPGGDNDTPNTLPLKGDGAEEPSPTVLVTSDAQSDVESGSAMGVDSAIAAPAQAPAQNLKEAMQQAYVGADGVTRRRKQGACAKNTLEPAPAPTTLERVAPAPNTLKPAPAPTTLEPAPWKVLKERKVLKATPKQAPTEPGGVAMFRAPWRSVRSSMAPPPTPTIGATSKASGAPGGCTGVAQYPLQYPLGCNDWQQILSDAPPTTWAGNCQQQDPNDWQPDDQWVKDCQWWDPTCFDPWDATTWHDTASVPDAWRDHAVDEVWTQPDDADSSINAASSKTVEMPKRPRGERIRGGSGQGSLSRYGCTLRQHKDTVKRVKGNNKGGGGGPGKGAK